MSILHAIVLGITQGLAEFLPISSSGHLIIVPWLFGWNDFAGNPELEKSFDVALHLGTLVAVVLYFRADIRRYLVAWIATLRNRGVNTDDERLAWALIISAAPGAVVGFLLDDFITKHLGEPWLIGTALVLFSFVMLFADRLKGQREINSITLKESLVVGCAQALALQPGVSRSGVTIVVGRLSGFSRDAAARFSFLMSIPIIAGAVGFKGLKLVLGDGIPASVRGPFVVGVIAAGLSGYLAISVLLKVIRTKSFSLFIGYRIFAGFAILALVASNFR